MRLRLPLLSINAIYLCMKCARELDLPWQTWRAAARSLAAVGLGSPEQSASPWSAAVVTSAAPPTPSSTKQSIRAKRNPACGYVETRKQERRLHVSFNSFSQMHCGVARVSAAKRHDRRQRPLQVSAALISASPPDGGGGGNGGCCCFLASPSPPGFHLHYQRF